MAEDNTNNILSEWPANLVEMVAPKIQGPKFVAQSHVISVISPLLRPMLLKYEINTDLRVCYFLGQAAEETDGFRTTEEYASGVAYEDRYDLGNTVAGDGRRYKGRGIFMLTGKFNYALFGKLIGVDLVKAPEKAAEPAISLELACVYWNYRKISPMADVEDIERVTRAINGGENGLESRQHYTELALRALGYK